MRIGLGRAVLTVILLIVSTFSSTEAQQEFPIADEVQVDRFAEMQYPSLARASRIEGTVVVEASMDDAGKVTDATVISGPHPVLMLAALTNVKKWTFVPNAKKTAVVIYNFTILPGVCSFDASLFVLQGRNLATVLTCPSVPVA